MIPDRTWAAFYTLPVQSGEPGSGSAIRAPTKKRPAQKIERDAGSLFFSGMRPIEEIRGLPAGHKPIITTPKIEISRAAGGDRGACVASSPSIRCDHPLISRLIADGAPSVRRISGSISQPVSGIPGSPAVGGRCSGGHNCRGWVERIPAGNRAGIRRRRHRCSRIILGIVL